MIAMTMTPPTTPPTMPPTLADEDPPVLFCEDVEDEEFDEEVEFELKVFLAQ